MIEDQQREEELTRRGVPRGSPPGEAPARLPATGAGPVASAARPVDEGYPPVPLRSV